MVVSLGGCFRQENKAEGGKHTAVGEAMTNDAAKSTIKAESFMTGRYVVDLSCQVRRRAVRV